MTPCRGQAPARWWAEAADSHSPSRRARCTRGGRPSDQGRSGGHRQMGLAFVLGAHLRLEPHHQLSAGGRRSSVYPSAPLARSIRTVEFPTEEPPAPDLSHQLPHQHPPHTSSVCAKISPHLRGCCHSRRQRCTLPAALDCLPPDKSHLTMAWIFGGGRNVAYPLMMAAAAPPQGTKQLREDM